jgi:hypothetical protein
MKLNGKPVDSRIANALKAELSQVGDKELLNFVASVSYLNVGFRKGKMPAAVALTRVCAELDKPQELTAWFRRFVQSIGSVRRIISVLSLETIKSAAITLCRALGAANVYAGALVDDRKDIVDWALGEIENWPDVQISEVEISQAKQELIIHFGAFQLILNDEQAVKSVTDSFAPKSIEVISKRSEKNRQQVLELRRARHEVSHLKNTVKKMETDLLFAKLELQSSHKELTETLAVLTQTRTDFAELTQAYETKVVAEVHKRVDTRILPWLLPAEALQTSLKNIGASDLLGRASAALEQQALVDRRYGVYQELEQKRAAHKEMLGRLHEAERQAIRPLPELASLSRAIEEQIAKLESQLGIEAMSTASSHTTALMRNVRQCTTLEDLSRFRATLQSITALGLFSPTEERGCYQVLHDIASRLYLTSCQGEAWQSALGHLSQLPLNELQIRLNAKEDCVLVVDGHNTLFQLESLFGSSFENGAPRRKSRQLLGEHLVALAKAYPRLGVELCFPRHVASRPDCPSDAGTGYISQIQPYI